MNSIINEIIEEWELGHDSPPRRDIEDALFEAYMRGAADGSMDSKIAEEALEFVSKL